MRFAIAATTVAALLLGAPAAQAEKSIFIIANDNDAYGVDHCLTTGGPCGTTVANSYCRSHDYSQALSFRKVDRDDITGAIPTGSGATCKGGNCDDFVAIECSR
jgi:hypothetical protein